MSVNMNVDQSQVENILLNTNLKYKENNDIDTDNGIGIKIQN